MIRRMSVLTALLIAAAPALAQTATTTTQSTDTNAAVQGQAQTGKLLSNVSRVTRSYLSRVFQLPATELTTTEFCELLAKEERVGLTLASTAQNFLKHCDELKFSSAPPPGPFDAVAESLKLVEQGEARLRETRRVELENAAEKARKANG